MPVDIRIEGAERLERLTRELKELGDKDLRRDLYRGINRATKPLKETVKQAALTDLPSKGGLNKFVASARLSTSTRGGRNPGVRITARKSGHDLSSIDRGRLRHPVFGNKNVWVNQDVKPGWFTRTLDRAADRRVRRELLGVIDDVARRVTRG